MMGKLTDKKKALELEISSVEEQLKDDPFDSGMHGFLGGLRKAHKIIFLSK